MKHLEWFNSLDPEVQAMLEDWEEIGGPQTESQEHYLVEDVAKSLRLSPITVREYTREGKIFARKLGRKWLIPVDAVARYIYNASHEQKADDHIPMGVVFVWSDRDGSILADYRFVSDKELVNFSSQADLKRFMGVKEGTGFWCELFPVLACENLLEDVGLLSPTLNEIKQKRGKLRLSDKIFELPPKMRFSFQQLASKDWFKMPIPLIEQEYKTIFGKDPDINDLRLLRMALVTATIINGDEKRLEEIEKWFLFGPLLEDFNGHLNDS